MVITSKLPRELPARPHNVTTSVQFSIVTPVLNSLAFLKRCVRSVADQDGPGFEHIVMDGGSTDGTVEWLRSQPSLSSVSNKDKGPHDALHKGYLRARGEYFGYLAADEQYLPGALKFAQDCFAQRPDADIIFGNFLTVHPDGTLIAYRKSYPARWPYLMIAHNYVHTCSMFFRRRIYDEGLHVDGRKFFTGDHDFMIRMLRAGYRASHVDRYIAAYSIHPGNLSATTRSRFEVEDTLGLGPWWVRPLKPVLNLLRYAEKIRAGAYHQRMPITYAIYPDENATERRLFTASKASPMWQRS